MKSVLALAISNDPEIVARFKQLSTDPVGNSADGLGAFIKARLGEHARILRAAGIKLD